MGAGARSECAARVPVHFTMPGPPEVFDYP